MYLCFSLITYTSQRKIYQITEFDHIELFCYVLHEILFNVSDCLIIAQLKQFPTSICQTDLIHFTNVTHTHNVRFPRPKAQKTKT